MYEYVCIMKFRVDVTSPRLQLEFSNNQAEENIHCFRESLNRQCDFFTIIFCFHYCLHNYSTFFISLYRQAGEEDFLGEVQSVCLPT